jgi:hypothetical protein
VEQPPTPTGSIAPVIQAPPPVSPPTPSGPNFTIQG